MVAVWAISSSVFVDFMGGIIASFLFVFRAFLIGLIALKIAALKREA